MHTYVRTLYVYSHVQCTCSNRCTKGTTPYWYEYFQVDRRRVVSSFGVVRIVRRYVRGTEREWKCIKEVKSTFWNEPAPTCELRGWNRVCARMFVFFYPSRFLREVSIMPASSCASLAWYGYYLFFFKIEKRRNNNKKAFHLKPDGKHNRCHFICIQRLTWSVRVGTLYV